MEEVKDSLLLNANIAKQKPQGGNFVKVSSCYTGRTLF